jgi:catechol 2,3-dioxygenase-like lactoylglutathione lyase family enzyme
MASACSHIGICVTDVERSQRFYEEVFGFRLAFGLRAGGEHTARLLRLDPDVALEARYLELPGLLLELLSFDNVPTAVGRERPFNETGLTHLSVLVDDIDAVRRAALSGGGRVREDTDVGGALVIEDPDGQAIEVIGPDAPFRALRARSVSA